MILQKNTSAPSRRGPTETAPEPQTQNRRYKRRWWQFSIRGMLLFCLFAGLLAAWWKDRSQLVRELNAARGSRISHSRWGVEEVLGPPDTPGAGDIATAWASATQDGQREWLILEYRKRVSPSAVEIHETYNPGAVDKVSIWNAAGNEIVVWQGTDPTPRGTPRGVSTIPIRAGFKTSKVKIYINSPQVPGWNEIDAVQLVGVMGQDR